MNVFPNKVFDDERPPTPVPVSVPVGVPVGLPISVPASVPVGLPISVPASVPVGIPVSVPAGVPANVPVSVRVSVPHLGIYKGPLLRSISSTFSMSVSAARPTSATSEGNGNANVPMPPPRVGQYFVGDAPAITRTLAAKPIKSVWGLVRLFDAVFRATGQPCFVNNTCSGVLILIAMAIDRSAKPEASGAALLGGTAAILTTVIGLGEKGPPVASGALALNGILMGATFGNGWALHRQSWLAGAIVILSALSAWMARSVSAILASWPPYGLPALNAPFNILATVFMLAATKWAPPTDATEILPLSNTTAPVDWTRVALGVIVSPGPVYACSSVISSCIIYIAFFIFSPILFGMSILGALTGTLLGALLCPAAKLSEVYSGHWGYNAMLTCMALGGFFFVFNGQSVLVAIAGAATAALSQAGMEQLIEKTKMPLLAWPFFTTTLIMLGAPTTSPKPPTPLPPKTTDTSLSSPEQPPLFGALTRVPLSVIVTPEANRRWWKSKERLLDRRNFLP